MSFDETRMVNLYREMKTPSVDSHVCRYYTRQPSPSQWVAIGIAALPPSSGDESHRLLVGTGPTESSAIRELRRRCKWMKSV